MGEHKKSGGVSFGRTASLDWSDLRTRQMVAADKGEAREVRFRGVTPDSGLCPHDHETLEEAWECSGSVVVVDEFNQIWSIYQAHKWGLIEIAPIQMYAASKVQAFDEDE